MNQSKLSKTLSRWTSGFFAATIVAVLVFFAFRRESESTNATPTADTTTKRDEQITSVPRSETAQPLDIVDDIQSIDWGSYEGMLVRIPGELVVVDTYDLARYGRITLARTPLTVPTDLIDPNDSIASGNTTRGGSNVSAVQRAQKFNDQSTIKLDDGFTDQNRFPIPLIPEFGTSIVSLRLGSTVTDLTGTVTENDGDHYVVPTEKLAIRYQKRPERPDLGDANLVVASFNVLNFFSTIDDGSNGARGADSLDEFERQRAKLVSAIIEMNADVIGMMELENNLESEQNLVSAINEKLGEEVFAGCGLPDDFSGAPGSNNPIRVGIIYRRDRVQTVGPLSLTRDAAFFNARTPLVQKFRRLNGEKEVVVIVNHFKSKGGRGASGANADRGDGQGAYNDSRRQQADAIANQVQSLGQTGDDNVLIIGDLNAYRQEDPIDTLRGAGLYELTDDGDRTPSFSYVYYGQAGSLDHAFATPQLANFVSGVATWHINSPEPRCADYNLEYNPRKCFRPDPYRCSDHDPILIGLRLP